jgi:DNA-binding transcriptional regulator YdaS (Cro superfamily)
MGDRVKYGAPPRPKDAREALEQVGRVLFGDDWKRPLAHRLGVSGGYVSQLSSGLKPINADFIARVREFISEQAAEEEAAHICKMIILKRFEVSPPKPCPAIPKT